MAQTVSQPTILVPVDASDPKEPSQALVDLLSPHELVILGYYPVPDQTAMDQARDQFGEEADEAIETITDRFADQGAEAEAVVVFTRDRSQTIDNTAAEYEVDAVLTAGDVGDFLDRILVPLRGDENLERIIGFLGVLLEESDATATIFNVAVDDDEQSRGEILVREACDQLAETEGIEPDRLDWRQERDNSPAGAVIDAASEYDLLIVGESEPSLTERILGEVTTDIIDQSSKPLLIVRNV